MQNLAGHLEILTQDEMDQIHQGAVSILEETGITIPDEEVLRLLADSGIKVEFDLKKAFFNEDQVKDAINKSPAEYKWHAKTPDFDLHIGGNVVTYGIASTISHVIDLEGIKRPATVADAINFSKLSNDLDLLCDAYCGVWPTDVPAGSEHAHMAYAQMVYSQKPPRARLHGLTQAQDSIAMARMIANGEQALKDKPMLMGLYSPLSPLAHTQEQFEGGIELIKNGQLLIICPGIYGGAIGPVTPAGTLTLITAEFLCMLTVAQIVNPGTPIGFGNFSSVLDMRTGAGPMSTPEGCLINTAVAQLARFYNVPSRGHAGTDSNLPDAQSGFESASKLLTGTLAGLNHISHSVGFVDGGRALSYESLFTDHEVLSFVNHYQLGMEVNEETLAVDLIKKMGPKGSYITEMHTLKHMRKNYIPELSNRMAWDNWQKAGATSMAQRANEKARSLLEKEHPEYVDEKLKAELLDYVKHTETRSASE